jgi:hypothetical protein
MIGVLDMGDEFSPFPGKMSAPPEQISGGAHVGRINIGHRHHTTPEQGRYLICVYFVVLGFAVMNRFHIERVAQDEGNVLFIAEIGEPVPSEDALYCYNNIFAVRSYTLQKNIGVCFNIPVKNDLALLVEDAKIHCPCVKVYTAGKFVLLGVKSHLRPPCEKGFGFLNHI